MRSHVLSFVILAGCVGVADLGSVSGDPDDSGGGGGAPPREQCKVDDDCVLAGATCCACPTFAVAKIDPIYRACIGVTCPPASSCSENVAAVCTDNKCELACAPLACENTSCPAGYAVDMNGCLSCECAVPMANGCSAASDCARTRADCCGCRLGGQDTAVLVRDRAQHDEMLMCPLEPACPGVDVCTADEPQCVQGRCELLPPGLPMGACGRADLAQCANGEVCTVNLSDPANMHGLGVCAPP